MTNYNILLTILIILVAQISDSYLTYKKTEIKSKEIDMHENSSTSNINMYKSSLEKFKINTKYYNTQENIEKLSGNLETAENFLISTRLKRENNYNESLEKLNPFPPSKQKKISPGDVTMAMNLNKHNGNKSPSNVTMGTQTSVESFYKQDANNESLKRVKVSGELKFLDVPPGGGMKVPGLKMEGGYVVFGYISGMVKGLQTADFPVGLIKEWMWNRLSFVQLIIQTIRVEGGIIGLLLCFLLLALALPSAVLAHVSIHCRCSFPSSSSDTHDIPVPPPQRAKCKRIVLVVLMDIILLCIPVGIVGMFLSNEHLAKSAGRSPEVSSVILEDVSTFIRNTHLQIRFVSTTAVDQATDAAAADLEDVETLLGKPIQHLITHDTGIDVALDALSDISSSSADIATEVLTLRAEAQAARDAARSAQDRLKELRRQVDQARRQCAEEDKVLCEMVESTGLEVVFNVDKLLSERKLSRLRHLGEDNLTSAAGDARQTYTDLPRRVDRDTRVTRQEIKIILRKQRDVLYTSTDALEEVSRDFLQSINIAENHVKYVVQNVTNLEQWRWVTGLASSLIVTLIWILLTFAAIFSHFNSDRVLPLYITSLILICTLSLCLWTVAAAALLLGGNGEILICKPLYDDPNYVTMTDLLDNPGTIFKQGGLFSNILKGNDSLDTPVKVLLSECRLNQPAFPTFQLRRIYNIDSLTNHLTWPKFHSHLNNISVNINDTQILKPNLQKFLQDLSSASRVNLTSYRQQMAGSVTLTDLGAFADQLERVAAQMRDLATSARMETIAARARKLLSNNIQRLEKHRDEIVYKITALEVHLLPLQRQANQSLSHLKTIQYYLNSQGENICKKKTNEYVTRVVKYLERFREHVLNQLTYEVAPCRPLWDAYDAARSQICQHIVSPMNAFWVSTVLCLLLFIILTPCIMLLTDYYKYMVPNGFLSRRELNELLLSDQGPWTTPHTPESITTPEQQSTWTSPRRTSEQYLIPPPRLSPEPPNMPPIAGPSIRRLIQTHYMAPSLKSQTENVGMSEPGTWRMRRIPSPRRWL